VKHLARIRECLRPRDVFSYGILILLLGYLYLRVPLGLPEFTAVHALLFTVCYLGFLYLSLLKFENRQLKEESVLRKKILRVERRIAFLEGRSERPKKDHPVRLAYSTTYEDSSSDTAEKQKE